MSFRSPADGNGQKNAEIADIIHSRFAWRGFMPESRKSSALMTTIEKEREGECEVKPPDTYWQTRGCNRVNS